MSTLSRETLRNYIKDSVKILKTCLQLIHQGQKHFYRVAAVQLRLLLCDTTRKHGKIINIALIPKWNPDIRFHPLKRERFSTALPPDMTLNTWLNQTVFITPSEELSLRDLIRRICEQDGGTHVDPKPHQGLPQNWDPTQWIETISVYLVTHLENTLNLD
jgi:hypothetical protein